eukprot:11009978-Alexandrium_andersonii.AAC.1
MTPFAASALSAAIGTSTAAAPPPVPPSLMALFHWRRCTAPPHRAAIQFLVHTPSRAAASAPW